MVQLGNLAPNRVMKPEDDQILAAYLVAELKSSEGHQASRRSHVNAENLINA